jgi:REP element-mobilizing transposase RayT
MKPKERLKPVKEFRVYRRNLPHLELPGSVYFITFNIAKGFTLSDSAKDIVLSTFRFHDGKKYVLRAYVIMDTHVHCILQPMEESPGVFNSLAQIMHSIKSYSANRIQRVLNVNGKIWQDENYDRIIRDEEEYLEKMNYIANNPLKAMIVEKPEEYKWLFVEGLG